MPRGRPKLKRRGRPPGAKNKKKKMMGATSKASRLKPTKKRLVKNPLRGGAHCIVRQDADGIKVMDAQSEFYTPEAISWPKLFPTRKAALSDLHLLNPTVVDNLTALRATTLFSFHYEFSDTGRLETSIRPKGPDVWSLKRAIREAKASYSNAIKDANDELRSLQKALSGEIKEYQTEIRGIFRRRDQFLKRAAIYA